MPVQTWQTKGQVYTFYSRILYVAILYMLNA